MESLKIRTGEKQIQILDDNDNERGIFHFNPEDIEAAKRFFEAQQEFKVKQKEFTDRVDTCETESDKIDLLHEVVQYLRDMIDTCFYAGASDTLFGENCSISMFDDFFTGIMPYYEAASKQRIEQYQHKRTTKK